MENDNAKYALWQARNQKVFRSNEMVQRGRYHLTWQQNCILLYMISKINPDDNIDKVYEFPIDELFSLLQYKTTSTTKLREAIKAIADESFWLISKDPNKDDILFRWIDKVHTNRGERVVRFTFQSEIAPYLFNLVKNNKGRFSGYKLSYILSLSSYYAQRLYDILMSYSNNNKYCFELGTMSKEHDLFILLCSDPTHGGTIPPSWLDNTSNFTKKVLEPSIKEINEYTDLKVDYDLSKYDLSGKKYRKIRSVIFYFRRRTNPELQKIDQRIDDNYKDSDEDYQKRLKHNTQMSIFDLEDEDNERLKAVMEIEEEAEPEYVPPEDNEKAFEESAVEDAIISDGNDNYYVSSINERYRFTTDEVRKRLPEIKDNELAQFILEAERHIGDEVDPACRDSWVMKYTTFYVDNILLSASTTPTKTTITNRILDNIIRDYKDYAAIVDRRFAKKTKGKTASVLDKISKSTFCSIEQRDDDVYEDFLNMVENNSKDKVIPNTTDDTE